MKVQYLGHACFVVTIGETKILIDPWFHGAFLGSWFPYPNNTIFENQLLEQEFDYLYISHTHEDHFDEKFLSKFNKNVKVLCPNYRSGSLKGKFKQLGFNNLIELGHKQQYTGQGWSAVIYLDVSHKEDSGLLLETEAATFLDLNDCNTKLTDLPSNVTYLAAQFSGAMWYPNCYKYSEEVMQEKTDSVRRDLLETLANKIKATNPQFYIPCAGPVCFLDPSLQKFNNREKTIFPTWEMVQEEFAKLIVVNVMPLQPGDIIENYKVDKASLNLPINIEEYSKQRRDEWNLCKYTPVETERLLAYFARLALTNSHLLTDVKRFGIRDEYRDWTVILDKAGAIVRGGIWDVGYEFTMPSYVLNAIITGKTGWEEALLSMRIRLKREPDVYDAKLFGLLRYGSEPSQTKQMIVDEVSSEMVTKGDICFQRYCPHAGEDLSNAKIEDGVIECPRHHWKWKLGNGECVKGGSIKLRTGIAPPCQK